MKSLKHSTALLLAFAIASLAICAAPLDAQNPAPVPVFKITPPQSIAAGDLATVAVDATSNVQDVQWVCVPPPINPNNFKAGGDECELVCGADEPDGGVFTIIAAANLNGKTLLTSTTVTFKKPTPPPPPGPQPGPTPPPTPVATHLWLITAYDASRPTPAIANLISDSAFWYGLAKEGHQFKFFDASAAAAKPYVDAAAKLGKSGPFVLFLDADSGKVLNALALPADEAAITAEVAALTGKSKET